jgi:hypothetical protein
MPVANPVRKSRALRLHLQLTWRCNLAYHGMQSLCMTDIPDQQKYRSTKPCLTYYLRSQEQ